ncbi:signal protein PDZ [Acaricomes phytoseiuli]|uniref:YlbL family protein n=1 Tax=Acaricomes phytoseiuli TaxID=291968 RepID=UPI001FE1BD7A|nr:S16 family serine protease [Acaricomes phytoseiuli]MCW1248999.1 signal protein PDZ [Acaricomes phytoseiuli]
MSQVDPGNASGASDATPSQDGPGNHQGIPPLPSAPPRASGRKDRQRHKRQRDPRALAMLVSGALAVGLGLLAVTLPAPYVIESPGPTINTLGEVQGQELISIEGTQSYPTSGQLDLVTVYVNGGPQSNVGAVDVFTSWLNPNRSVLPVELVYPANTTLQDVTAFNQAEMTGSQDSARAAALNFLDIPYEAALSVRTVQGGFAADGVLDVGDEIKTVNGTPVSSAEGIQEILAAGQGAPVDVEIVRAQQPLTVQVTPQLAPDGRYLLGIGLRVSYTFPFSINFNLENVGGPSAGMMFALGTIDMLTPGELTGGQNIAGTGTIDPSGNVGPIGGVKQKMISAKESGASLFLASRANCSEIAGNIPDGLQVAAVDTLQEAYDAVSAAASGDGAEALPQCNAS